MEGVNDRDCIGKIFVYISFLNSLFILNTVPVDPKDVVITVTGEDVLQINGFIQRENELDPYGYVAGEAYYVGGWEKRIAYVEAGYNPYGYAPFRIDIYPFLSQGTFTVEVYYKGNLIARSKIYMNTVDPEWCQLENKVRLCEKQSWDEQMTALEKIDALADYVRKNTMYNEVDCKTGSQILFCGAMDLGIEACVGFDNSNCYSYDYRSVANPFGHTWCVVSYMNEIVRYDVQGYICKKEIDYV